MFDIETGIRDWRQALLAREAMSAQDVDELEDHLREEYASLRAPPTIPPPLLSEEESFLIATRRLGRADAIAGEFAKADPGAAWRRRAMLLLAGYVGIDFSIDLARSAGVLAAGSVRSDYGALGWVAVNGAATLAVLLGAFVCARSLARGGRVANRVKRHSRRLLSPLGLVLATLLALGATTLLTPLSQIVVLRTQGALGGLMQPTAIVTPYPQVLVTLAPCVLLCLLVWRDRERLKREDSIPS